MLIEAEVDRNEKNLINNDNANNIYIDYRITHEVKFPYQVNVHVPLTVCHERKNNTIFIRKMCAFQNKTTHLKCMLIADLCNLLS